MYQKWPINKFNLLALVVFLVFNRFEIDAQVNHQPSIESLSNLSLKQWTSKDGLSSNNITSVFQDSNGLIWMTTFNGFEVYDAEKFETYDKRNVNILESDAFYCVTEATGGQILFGSQGSGIIIYDKGIVSKLRIDSGFLPRSIREIHVSSSHEIYAGSDNFGLFKIRDHASTPILAQELSDVTVKAIHESENGDLWIGTEGKGVYVMSSKDTLHYTMENGLLSNSINAIESDSLGNVYIGSYSGLQRTQYAAMDSFYMLANQYVNCLFIDELNQVWIGGESDVLRFDPHTESIEGLNQQKGMDLSRISSIICDREGNIWMSSVTGGLVRLKKSLTTYLTRPAISGDRVYYIHESSVDEKLYIVTDRNAVDVCEGSECESIILAPHLSQNGIRDIYHDSDGSLWLATYVGIVQIQSNKQKYYNVSSGMPANSFRVIHKDIEGFFWFGTRSGGLVKFKDQIVNRVYSNGEGLESNFVLSIDETSTGKLYIGTHSGGLSVIDSLGQATTYHLRKDDSGVILFNTEFIRGEEALIASNVGLVHFDGRRLTQIYLQEDEVSRTFYDVISDDFQDIWVTSNKGILKIEREDLEQYLIGDIDLLSYEVFNEHYGMNNEECTGATRSTKLKDGTIMIPTLGGVCKMNPGTLVKETPIPVVQVRRVIADQVSLDLYNDHEISAGVKRMTFHFSALSYLSPDRNRYKYKLEGFDRAWSEPSVVGTIEYTNLPPGRFVFRVLGSTDGYNWTEKGDSFSFRVLPMFYETLWFYFLMVSFVILLLVLTYKSRVAYVNRQNSELRKVNAELDRFVYSASHEMRSPLTSILGLVQVARNDKGSNLTIYLNHIESSIRRLDVFINEIIDYSRNARLTLRTKEINLKDVVDGIISEISYTDNFLKIKCKVDIEDDLHLITDADRLRILLGNLITNAFKHHAPDDIENPFVSIRAFKMERGVKIKVADNGPGIEKKLHKEVFKMFYRATTRTTGSGLGLYMVNEIIEKLNGKMRLESKLNQGTTFSIQLPHLPMSKDLVNG